MCKSLETEENSRLYAVITKYHFIAIHSQLILL